MGPFFYYNFLKYKNKSFEKVAYQNFKFLKKKLWGITEQKSIAIIAL